MKRLFPCLFGGLVERNKQHCIEGVIGEIRNPNKGFGLYAVRLIPAGTTVCIWGGDVVNFAALKARDPVHQMHSVQIDDEFYLVPTGATELPDLLNHSCDPNTGIKGQITVVAIRDIAPGEELSFDYAMTDGSQYDEFHCACGTALCRGKVTGNDWMRPDLQARYRGWFSYYLQRRIDTQRIEVLDFQAIHPAA